MKALKILAGVVVAVIALLLVVAALAPKNYAVVREVTIARPAADVYNYAKYLKNQDNFSVWARKDPAMKKEYRGADGTIGFVSAWDSNVEGVGKGEQEITNITEGKRIDYALHFIKPFESRSDAFMSFTPVGDSTTKVQWGFSGTMAYPMNLFMLVMDMDASVGKDFAEGLSNLKGIVEK